MDCIITFFVRIDAAGQKTASIHLEVFPPSEYS